MAGKINSNFSKPKGIVGSLILNGMNRHHLELTEWGLAFADVTADKKAVDIGCGGGNAIRLMALAGGCVAGIDYSPLSVKKALKFNKTAVAEGRVEIRQASVEDIPFADDTFDIATAFETIYFWPDWKQNFGEVRRILQPGGRFFAVYEWVRDDAKRKTFEENMGMKIPRAEALAALLEEAGFESVRIERKPDRQKDTVCVIGEK